jgi:guanylate kinase
MIKPVIGIDWDDVTAPFNSIACEMANEEYGIEPALTIEDITSWANTGRASVIHKYYHDMQLYEEQSRRIPEKNISCIKKLMEIADVYFITAVYPDFAGVRVKQITDAFKGEIGPEKIILGSTKHLVQFDVILDDNIDNVLNSPAKHAVLMRKPWNRSMTGLLSVNNLEEFMLLIYQIYAAEHIPSVKYPSVVALVGPSGSGKNEVMDELTESHPEYFMRPVSYTTEPKVTRKRHISEWQFLKEDFLEKTRYAGYGYGTKEADVSSILESGKNAVMPLDICGAIGMKKKFPTVIVYLNRGKEAVITDIISREIPDSEKVLRILSVEAEKKNAEICDFSIDSSDVKKAAAEIIKLFRRNKYED